MIAKGYDGPVYDGEPNQFNSSFWIEHRWMFQCIIDINQIIYSICPYK
jgi:hypothetical protein